MKSVQEADLHICVAHPSAGAASETFIRDHVSRIVGVQTVASHGSFPRLLNGEPLFGSVYSGLLKVASRVKSLKGFSSARKTRRLASVFSRRGVQVVLAEYAPTACAVLDSCLRADVPLVVHFHGQDAFHRPMIDQYRADYQRLFRHAAGFIVGTDEMSQQIVSLGAPADLIHKNPCGVDTELFQPIDCSKNPPTFVALGRFVEKKCPHITLLAFAKVLESVPEAKLVMIGGGSLLEACKQLAKALGVSESVTLTGVLDQSEVPKYMRSARCFVQHSATPESGDSEGTSISVLEAAASGLSVVSTRHGGIKDSVVHEQTGLLVEEYDLDGMARCMTTLARDPQLAGQFGAAGRKRMIQVYRIEDSLERLRQILMSVLRDSASG